MSISISYSEVMDDFDEAMKHIRAISEAYISSNCNWESLRRDLIVKSYFLMEFYDLKHDDLDFLTSVFKKLATKEDFEELFLAKYSKEGSKKYNLLCKKLTPFFLEIFNERFFLIDLAKSISSRSNTTTSSFAHHTLQTLLGGISILKDARVVRVWADIAGLFDKTGNSPLHYAAIYTTADRFPRVAMWLRSYTHAKGHRHFIHQKRKPQGHSSEE